MYWTALFVLGIQHLFTFRQLSRSKHSKINMKPKACFSFTRISIQCLIDLNKKLLQLVGDAFY